MSPITIAYPVFVLLIAALCVLAFFLCLRVVQMQQLRREKSTLARAYAELAKGAEKREADLVKERNAWAARATVAEADADRLAPVVGQYLKDIDETAALLKDEQPPTLKAEREALCGHHKALILRSNETTIPEIRPDEKSVACAIAADAAGGC